MMKRKLSLIPAVCLVFLLCACGGSSVAKDAAVPSPAEAEASVSAEAPAASEQETTALSAGEQIGIILDKLSLWDRSPDQQSEYEQYYYAVTDLDMNGRLEIFSAITQGTGIYTSGRLYELDESFSELVLCENRSSEHELLPELIVSSAPRYTDAHSGTVYYIFNDNTRNGAAEFYNSVNALYLRDGELNTRCLARYSNIYTGSVGKKTYTNAENETISEQQYNAAADEAFADCTCDTVRFGWFTIDAGDTAELLNASFEVFSGSLDAMPDLISSLPYDSAINIAAPSSEAADITITKNPTSEALAIGGKTWFIAHASGADSIEWRFADSDGKDFSLDDTMAANPGLVLRALEGDTILIDNVPLSLNGWSVFAVFSNAAGQCATAPAEIYVGDYLSAYSEVINRYRDCLASGEELTPGTAYRFGVSEIVSYSEAVGYALKDLDKDSVPELIIAGIGYYYSAECPIYEIYTLSGGQDASMSVVPLCCSTARDRYFLRTDSTIFNFGSSGAAYTSYYLLQLSNGSLKPIFELKSGLDNSGNEYWLYTQYSLGNEQTVSREQADSIYFEYSADTYVPPLTKIE